MPAYQAHKKSMTPTNYKALIFNLLYIILQA